MSDREIIYVEQKRGTSPIAWGCLGIIIFFVVIGFIGSSRIGSHQGSATSRPTDSRPKPPPDHGEDAYYAGVSQVRAQLKAPSTAKFSNPRLDSNTGWLHYGYHQWEVFGHVDAQNAFGAMLRQNWSAIVEYVDSENLMKVHYVRLGDQTYGTEPAIRRSPAQIQAIQDAQAQQALAAKDAADQKKLEAAAAALKYHQDQAESGDAYAQYQLGRRYLRGDGVEKDDYQARRWLGKAASQGNTDAQQLLRSIPASHPISSTSNAAPTPVSSKQ